MSKGHYCRSNRSFCAFGWWVGDKLNARKGLERLNYPIDRNIEWSIRGYDEDKKEAVRAAGVIGVLHDLPLDIGRVKIKNHVFVVPNASSPLLFVRTFGRAAQVT